MNATIHLPTVLLGITWLCDDISQKGPLLKLPKTRRDLPLMQQSASYT